MAHNKCRGARDVGEAAALRLPDEVRVAALLRQMAHNKCRGARGPEQTPLPCHGSGACEESCKGLGSVSLKINNQHTHPGIRV